MLPAFASHLEAGDAVSSRTLDVINKLNGPIRHQKHSKTELTKSAEEFGASLRLYEIADLIHVDDIAAFVKNMMLNVDKIEDFTHFFRSDGKERIFVFFQHVTKVKECEYSVTNAVETEADTLVSRVEYGISLLMSLSKKSPFGTKEEEIRIGEKTNMALYHLLSGHEPDFGYLSGEEFAVTVLKNWTELIVEDQPIRSAFSQIERHLEEEHAVRYSLQLFSGLALSHHTNSHVNFEDAEILNLVDLLFDIRSKKNLVLKTTGVDSELPLVSLSSDHHDRQGLLRIVKELIQILTVQEGVTKKTYLESLTVAELVILYIKQEFIQILSAEDSDVRIAPRTIELCEKTCYLLDLLQEKLVQGRYTYKTEMLFAQCESVEQVDELFGKSLVLVFAAGSRLEEFREWYSFDVLWASVEHFDFEGELVLQRLRGSWMGFGWIKPQHVEPAVARTESDSIFMQLCPENLNGRRRLWRCRACENPVRERARGRLVCGCGSFDEEQALYKCLRRSHVDYIPYPKKEEVKPVEPPKRVQRPPSPIKIVEKPAKRHPDPIVLPSNGTSSPLSKKNPVNIVFVGPATSGKSTLINAMAYYCTHFHFNNTNHNIPQIPFKFTVVDAGGHEFVLQSKGELEEGGASKRMSSDGTERSELIDRTGHQPGRDHDFFWQRQYCRMFDTRGVVSAAQSPEALADIADVLAKLDNHVHGLFIVVPGIDEMPDPNDWYFALTQAIAPELLSKAYFVFTGVEDPEKNKNFNTLVRFLRKNWIHLDWDKFYGIDNSCFLYLCAKHAGIALPEMQLNQKEKWWNARSHIVGLVNKVSRDKNIP